MQTQSTPQNHPAQSSRFTSPSPRLSGIRPGADWSRNWKASPEKLAQLTPGELLEHLRLTHRHTSVREWTHADRSACKELARRAWDVGTLSRMHVETCPRWVAALCYVTTKTGQRRHRAAWKAFLGWLVGAFRAGAVGLRGDYSTIAAELGIGYETWRRHRNEMEAAGLIRVVHTFRDASELKKPVNYKRANDDNLYQLGPALLKAWHALLVGVDLGETFGAPSKARTKFAAARMNREARKQRRARELELRARVERRDAHVLDGVSRLKAPAGAPTAPPAQPVSKSRSLSSRPGPSAPRGPRSAGRANARRVSSTNTQLRGTTRPAGQGPLKGPLAKGNRTLAGSGPVPTAPAEKTTNETCSPAVPVASRGDSRPTGSGPLVGGSGTLGTPPRTPGQWGEQESSQVVPRDTRPRVSAEPAESSSFGDAVAADVPAFLRDAPPAVLLSMGVRVDPRLLCQACGGRGKRPGAAKVCRRCGGTGRKG